MVSETLFCSQLVQLTWSRKCRLAFILVPYHLFHCKLYILPLAPSWSHRYSFFRSPHIIFSCSSTSLQILFKLLNSNYLTIFLLSFNVGLIIKFFGFCFVAMSAPLMTCLMMSLTLYCLLFKEGNLLYTFSCL